MTEPGLMSGVRRHWFVPVALLLLAIELAVVRTADWSRERHLEIVVLCDMTLSIPLLHALCYHRILPTRTLLIRTAGLCCLGFYLASWLVPPASQRLLDELGWLRIAGLAVLALIELRLVIAAISLAFGGRADAAAVAEKTGAPEWVARLMLLEARLWKALWRRLRGR